MQCYHDAAVSQRLFKKTQHDAADTTKAGNGTVFPVGRERRCLVLQNGKEVMTCPSELKLAGLFPSNFDTI